MRSTAPKPTAPSTSAAPMVWLLTNAEKPTFVPSAKQISASPAVPAAKAARSAD